MFQREKWMIPDHTVQHFHVNKMKIFLERSMAIFKSKITIFRPKIVVFGPFWHLRDMKVLNNILKWMIPDSIVQLFAVNQKKIFVERSMAIFKFKMAMALCLLNIFYLQRTYKSIFFYRALKNFHRGRIFDRKFGRAHRQTDKVTRCPT